MRTTALLAKRRGRGHVWDVIRDKFEAVSARDNMHGRGDNARSRIDESVARSRSRRGEKKIGRGKMTRRMKEIYVQEIYTFE